MSNMKVWDAVCTPPPWALKKIAAGRMAGKTDINPQWRIKALTEQFGMCGEGWKIVVVKKWTELGANGEIMCFVDIDLYIRLGENKWSEPIPGSGGSKLISAEKEGKMFNSDEGYKMATTDAISVACKMIGVAADIYQGEEYSKYNQHHGDDKTKSEKGEDAQIHPVTADEIAIMGWIAKATTTDHITVIKGKMQEVAFSSGAEKRINTAIAKRESEISASMAQEW